MGKGWDLKISNKTAGGGGDLQKEHYQGLNKSIRITPTIGHSVPRFFVIILRLVPYTFYYSKNKFRFVF